MSTDRELLELAAKAAGLFIVGYDDVNLKGIAATEIPIKNLPFVWNPLTDDGDVARLESVTSISVMWHSTSVSARTPDFFDGRKVFHEFYAEHGGSKQKARRHASTMAAAEIGKSK